MAKYNKEQRINVYKGTLDDISNGFYTDNNGNKHDLELDSLLKGSRSYIKVKVTESEENFDTLFYAQIIDCVQKAYDFGKEGALLNMASRFKAGGGVLNGSSAQEEEIFRRTTLPYSLYYYDEVGRSNISYKVQPPSFSAYPFKSDKAAIWSPGVIIFRKGSNNYYDYMVSPGVTNVITVPAVQKPELTEEGQEFKESDARMWRNKIRTVLRVALMNNKYKIVLGAWGCGAYGNPPRLVAKLFKDIFEEPEFKGKFKEVCFAILEDKNSPKGGNYAPFAEIFGHK